MRTKIILILIWILILIPSYLFPKWTYIQIKTYDNKPILLKYEAPRSFRFNKPPLDIDYNTPGWHGLKEPKSFDIVEVENNWMN